MFFVFSFRSSAFSVAPPLFLGEPSNLWRDWRLKEPKRSLLAAPNPAAHPLTQSYKERHHSCMLSGCGHWCVTALSALEKGLAAPDTHSVFISFKPIIIVLGSAKQQCHYKIMLSGAWFKHEEASPGIKKAKSPCIRQALLPACFGSYCWQAG